MTGNGFLDSGGASVGACIIDNDELDVGLRLAKNRVDSFLYKSFLIVTQADY